MSWHLGTRKMIWWMFTLRHTFGAIMPLAYTSISGARLSHGLYSCRVAPLCLLRLEVRTGRLVGPVGMNCRCHMVSDLFQTCKNG